MFQHSLLSQTLSEVIDGCIILRICSSRRSLLVCEIDQGTIGERSLSFVLLSTDGCRWWYCLGANWGDDNHAYDAWSSWTVCDLCASDYRVCIGFIFSSIKRNVLETTMIWWQRFQIAFLLLLQSNMKSMTHSVCLWWLGRSGLGSIYEIRWQWFEFNSKLKSFHS